MIVIVFTVLLTVVACGLGILSITVVTWVGNIHTYVCTHMIKCVCRLCIRCWRQCSSLAHSFLLIRMLKDFNMEHVCHQNFYDFFTEHRNNADDVELMYKMQAMDRKSVRASAAHTLN